MTGRQKSPFGIQANQLSSEELEELMKAIVDAATRLRSARLAAGYLVVRDAAEQVGFSMATYRHAESSLNEISDAMAHACAGVFGVTVEFLTKGRVDTPRERLALRIFDVLTTVRETNSDATDDYSLRLREMRLDAGFRRLKDAALENGWSLPTYGAHEAGGRIPVERMIGYALAFGFRPEFAVLGQFPKRSADGEEQGWLDLRAKGLLPTGPGTKSWTWLRTSTRDGIPLLIVGKDRVSLSDQRVSLPSEMFASSDLPRTAFGVLGLSQAHELFIVSATLKGEAVVVASPGGEIRVDREHVLSEATKDPVKRPLKAETVLGELLGRFVLSGS